jgi:hypothetical protein
MANTEWDVRGVSKKDGRNVRLTLRAPNQRAAELAANDRGMAVESCWPLQASDGAAEPATVALETPAAPSGGGFWRLLRNLGLLAILIGAGLVAVEWFFNKGENEAFLIGGGGAFAVGLLLFLFCGFLGRRSRYR